MVFDWNFKPKELQARIGMGPRCWLRVGWGCCGPWMFFWIECLGLLFFSTEEGTTHANLRGKKSVNLFEFFPFSDQYETAT